MRGRKQQESEKKKEKSASKQSSLGVPRLHHLGRGSGTKQPSQARSALRVSEAGVFRAGHDPLGMPGAPTPRARSTARLTFAGAASAHFRGPGSGCWGRSRGTGSRPLRGGRRKPVAKVGAGTGGSERNPRGDLRARGPGLGAHGRRR